MVDRKNPGGWNRVWSMVDNSQLFLKGYATVAFVTDSGTLQLCKGTAASDHDPTPIASQAPPSRQPVGNYFLVLTQSGSGPTATFNLGVYTGTGPSDPLKRQIYTIIKLASS